MGAELYLCTIGHLVHSLLQPHILPHVASLLVSRSLHPNVCHSFLSSLSAVSFVSVICKYTEDPSRSYQNGDQYARRLKFDKSSLQCSEDPWMPFQKLRMRLLPWSAADLAGGLPLCPKTGP